MFDPIQITTNSVERGRAIPNSHVDAIDSVVISTGPAKGRIVGYIGYDSGGTNAFMFADTNGAHTFYDRELTRVFQWALGCAYRQVAMMDY